MIVSILTTPPFARLLKQFVLVDKWQGAAHLSQLALNGVAKKMMLL